jgi:D-glycero-alpha-D-manno-heptose-7-phosphate kinase
MVISRTPFRVSFFGGGTDYPAWYRQHGGCVLAATIDKYCYLTCRYLPPFFEHRLRVVYSKIESAQTADEIVHPSVRETLKFLKLERGLEIHHDGDLPGRSGMGSSSSFTVGLLHALYALQGQMIGKERLARESIHIEQEILKETVGSQDQVCAAHGGVNHITFQTNGDVTVRPLTVPEERVRELNSHLMLFYTGIKRTASDIAASYVNSLDSRTAQLKQLKQLVDRSVEILSGSGDLREFGRLLHEAWEAKRSMSSKISSPMVDEMYDQARSAGALGGKLLGAGGGGFILLFVPPENQPAVREKLARLIHVPFEFEYSGSQIIFFDREVDYAEQDRLRASQPVAAFRELTHSS